MDPAVWPGDRPGARSGGVPAFLSTAVLTVAAPRVMANQLWGVSARDPMTLTVAVAVMTLAGLAACYAPARRATRVDPNVALRYE